MDFGEIEFTEWQIDKVRDALNNYRTINTRNGRSASWSRIRDDIIYSDVNIDRYSEDDAELAFKSEALRRFAVRITVLQPEKLMDVTRFLIHEKLIDIEQLDERNSSLREMLAAHQFLAIKTEPAKEFMSAIGGIYIASAKGECGIYETFTLRIITDPSKEFVRVEEIHEVSVRNLFDCKTPQERESCTIVRMVRSGYGFAVTEEVALHIFLSGKEPTTMCAAYVQVGRTLAGNNFGKLCFIRNGPRHTSPPSRMVQPDGSIKLFNALDFSLKILGSIRLTPINSRTFVSNSVILLSQEDKSC